MRRPAIIWTSPLSCCDICGKRFGQGEDASPVMYDANLKGGPWGNVCEADFKLYGKGLGTGLGQRYELQTLPDSDQRAWIGTAGFEGMLDN